MGAFQTLRMSNIHRAPTKPSKHCLSVAPTLNPPFADIFPLLPGYFLRKFEYTSSTVTQLLSPSSILHVHFQILDVAADGILSPSPPFSFLHYTAKQSPRMLHAEWIQEILLFSTEVCMIMRLRPKLLHIARCLSVLLLWWSS